MKNGPYELVVAPDGYPGKRYRGRYCYEHHLVWWRAHGAVPSEDEVIHHKDRNKRNNVLDNLELVSKTAHKKEHAAEQLAVYVELRCPACGALFIRRWHLVTARFGGTYCVCSKKCRGRMSGRGRPVDASVTLESQIIRKFQHSRLL